jgi:hypothetical protein
VPDLSDPQRFALWTETERAKRRLLYTSLTLALPLGPSGAKRGLHFRLLADARVDTGSVDPPAQDAVTIGHDQGQLTMNVAEADDSHREAMRKRLNEPYRTMLGHLRHEIGHYYWLVLVDGGGSAVLDGFRELFGDERQDYGAALQAHYGDDTTDDWSGEHISHYATMHPWEDFAETFAHYLHIADVLETTAAVGVTVEGPHGVPEPLAGRIRSTGADRIADLPIDDVLGRWHGTALALNAMSRSMGRQDLYPFVITPGVSRKLAFVHELVGSPAAS